MIIGYARVSTEQQSINSTKKSQDPQLQTTPLESYGCERMYIERASGGKWEREQLHLMLDSLQQGDQVVVWKVDRLSRSLKDLLEILDRIEKSGASFKSLTEPIDTTNSFGKMALQIRGVFSELERSVISERTKAGLQNALDKGKKLGRKYNISIDTENTIISLVESKAINQKEVAKQFNLNPSTVSRIMRRNRKQEAIAHEV